MEQPRRTLLEINVVSAKGLVNVNRITPLKVYAVVSIQGDPQHPEQSTKTHTDREGRRNPTWISPMTFTLYGGPAQHNRLSLVFELRCDHRRGDRHVGRVAVPIELLNKGDHQGQSIWQAATYQVMRPKGDAKGKLTFSYKFDHGPAAVSDVSYGAPPPSYAGYAAPPTATSRRYSPPFQAASYGHLPPAGQQQSTMNNNLAAAMAAGFVGPVLGGLFVGDLDDAEAYDAGYDAGFADYGPGAHRF